MNRRLIAGGLVGLFLSAIVGANLISAHFGPGASIYNAFFLIGLTLTTRDRLHDLWGRNRFRNMALLIPWRVGGQLRRVPLAGELGLAFGCGGTDRPGLLRRLCNG